MRESRFAENAVHAFRGRTLRHGCAPGDKIENCLDVGGFTDKDWAELDKLSPPPK